MKMKRSSSGRSPDRKNDRKKVVFKKHPPRPRFQNEDRRDDGADERPREAEPTGLSRKGKLEAVAKGFDKLWTQLFSSPVHLDSLLSKQPHHLKSILAQIVPVILLRPVSQAELVGVGIAPDEPWILKPEVLKGWKPARQIASRLYETMSQGVVGAAPMLEDFPPLMTEEWTRTWGVELAKKLATLLAAEPPLGIRASKRTGAAALLKELKTKDKIPVQAEASGFAPFGVRLKGYTPVMGTSAYERGDLEIQDEGSQLMALFALWPEKFAGILRDKPGPVEPGSWKTPELPSDPPAWTVVDACAGAGGKSLAIADALGGKGRVYAYDVSPKKLQALRRRATRAGVNNIQTVTVTEGEESQVTKKFAARAQAVLVDAPCSGWGVLRRNPDIKWRQSVASLEKMPAIQLRLLTEYSRLVAPGGRLVFGVCTFRKEETTEVVRRFLDANPKFRATHGGYLGPGPCDGFFMQAFELGAEKKK